MIKALTILTFDRDRENNAMRIEKAIKEARIRREDIISVNYSMVSYNVGNMVILYEKGESK